MRPAESLAGFTGACWPADNAGGRLQKTVSAVGALNLVRMQECCNRVYLVNKDKPKKTARRKMPKTDPSKLMQLMESKDASELAKYGGVDGLALSLGSDSQAGLSSTSNDALKEQRKFYGENVWERKPPPTVWGLFLEAIQDSTLIILLVAAGYKKPYCAISSHCWQPDTI